MKWRKRARAEELRALELELATIRLEGVRSELIISHAQTEDARASLARREGELSSLVARVTTTCDRLEQRFDDDRADRRALSEALVRVAEVLATRDTSTIGTGSHHELENAQTTVIGGTINIGEQPSSEIGETDDMIVLPDESGGAITAIDEVEGESGAVPLGAGDECAVRFRFDNRWIDGFEICETVRTHGRLHYRLRRRLDGWVLPEMFDPADVRRFEHTIASGAYKTD
ncbi:MAG: hypothetical protein EXQ69_06110 [Acidimicrobiia bacterium]|nr:hypothetical protein [Acidimicrobiia bacterium]